MFRRDSQPAPHPGGWLAAIRPPQGLRGATLPALHRGATHCSGELPPCDDSRPARSCEVRRHYPDDARRRGLPQAPSMRFQLATSWWVLHCVELRDSFRGRLGRPPSELSFTSERNHTCTCVPLGACLDTSRMPRDAVQTAASLDADAPGMPGRMRMPSRPATVSCAAQMHSRDACSSLVSLTSHSAFTSVQSRQPSPDIRQACTSGTFNIRCSSRARTVPAARRALSSHQLPRPRGRPRLRSSCPKVAPADTPPRASGPNPR
jgi:hypothetical protein